MRTKYRYMCSHIIRARKYIIGHKARQELKPIITLHITVATMGFIIMQWICYATSRNGCATTNTNSVVIIIIIIIIIIINTNNYAARERLEFEHTRTRKACQRASHCANEFPEARTYTQWFFFPQVLPWISHHLACFKIIGFVLLILNCSKSALKDAECRMWP